MFVSAHCLVMLYIYTKFREIISNGIKSIERTHDFYTENYKGEYFRKKSRWSNRCLFLHIDWACFIFLPSFVKLSQTVSKL